jgi:hypothetical protein
MESIYFTVISDSRAELLVGGAGNFPVPPQFEDGGKLDGIYNGDDGNQQDAGWHNLGNGHIHAHPDPGNGQNVAAGLHGSGANPGGRDMSPAG